MHTSPQSFDLNSTPQFQIGGPRSCLLCRLSYCISLKFVVLPVRFMWLVFDKCLVTLTFYLKTCKWRHRSPITWASILPIFSFIYSFIFHLWSGTGHTYRQTVVINPLCPTLRGGRIKWQEDTTRSRNVLLRMSVNLDTKRRLYCCVFRPWRGWRRLTSDGRATSDSAELDDSAVTFRSLHHSVSSGTIILDAGNFSAPDAAVATVATNGR